MEKENVENSIHSIIMDGTHKLQVSSQTREILGIITAYRVVYADLIGWLEKHRSLDDRLNEEAFDQMKPFLDYLEGWLLDSITENTGSVPFNGI